MPRRYWYILLTYVLMHLSVFIAAPLMLSNFSLSLQEVVIYWNIISFLGATIIILFLLRKEWGKPISGAASFPQVITWSIIGIFLAYFSQIIAVLIETQVFGIEPGSENTFQIMELTRSIPLFMIVPMILAPILEEIVFRKIIFGAFYKRLNFFIAALLSSLIFGLIHGEPQHIIVYASMGFVFAYLYVKTKRIIVPIFAHAAMNSITVFIQYSIDPEELERMRQQLKEMMIFLGY